MLSSTFFAPPQHGSAGPLDELILLCLPFVIGIILFDILVERARRRHDRRRARSKKGD